MTNKATGPAAVKLYRKVMTILNDEGIHYMIGGGISLAKHADIERIKDLDIFCKPGDYPRIMHLLQDNGISGIIRDEKWLAQIKEGNSQVDFIFSTPNGVTPVDDDWFTHAKPIKIFGLPVLVVPPEEIIASKIFRHGSKRCDSADINHIILKLGSELNWHRLLARLEPHWEMLLTAIVQFRFVFPSEREKIPKWLLEELLDRLKHQMSLPAPTDKICRGVMLSWADYETDIKEGGYYF